MDLLAEGFPWQHLCLKDAGMFTHLIAHNPQEAIFL